MTPNFAIIRIQNQAVAPTARGQVSVRGEGNRPSSVGWTFWGFPIILPLFLFWIPAILLSPFVLVVLWPVCVAVDISFSRTVATFWNLLCGLPGTDVRVCAEGKRITVRIL